MPRPQKPTRVVEETQIKTAQILKLAGSINEQSLAPTDLMQLWNVHIRVRKYAVNGSFNIHVFIGWVKDEQPERFLTKKNEAVFMGVFATTDRAQCTSCKKNRERDIRVEDVVPLSTYLNDYLTSNPKRGGLIAQGQKKTIDSLNPSEVVPFLTEHLKRRMTDLRSQLIDGREQEAELEVVVTNQTYIPPDPEHSMGSCGPPTVYEDITRGQPGGLGYVYPAVTA